LADTVEVLWGHPGLAHLEAAQALRLLVRLVDAVDLGAARAFAHERDHPLDCVVVALEDGFDRAVGAVRDPSRDAGFRCAPACRVAEEDALHPPVRYDALA